MDGGSIWTAANLGLTNPRVWTVLSQPTASGTVFAGVAGAGSVYRTLTGGE